MLLFHCIRLNASLSVTLNSRINVRVFTHIYIYINSRKNVDGILIRHGIVSRISKRAERIWEDGKIERKVCARLAWFFEITLIPRFDHGRNSIAALWKRFVSRFSRREETFPIFHFSSPSRGDHNSRSLGKYNFSRFQLGIIWRFL